MKVYLPLTLLLLSFLSVNSSQGLENDKSVEFWVSEFQGYEFGSYQDYSGLLIFQFEFQHYNPNQEPTQIIQYSTHSPRLIIELEIDFTNTSYQMEYYPLTVTPVLSPVTINPGITKSIEKVHFRIFSEGVNGRQNFGRFLPDGNYSANYIYARSGVTSYPLNLKVVSGEIFKEITIPVWKDTSIATSNQQPTSSQQPTSNQQPTNILNLLFIIFIAGMILAIVALGILLIKKRGKLRKRNFG